RCAYCAGSKWWRQPVLPVASTCFAPVPRRWSITTTLAGRERSFTRPAGAGVDGAANTARGGAISALQAVRDGGRLATITSDPPGPERGIEVDSIYVRPDAAQLDMASQDLSTGRMELTIGASFPLEQAEAALNRASAGLGGAGVLDVC